MELLNTDAKTYAGSGVVNAQSLGTEETPWQGQPWSVLISLPPLGVVFLAHA